MWYKESDTFRQVRRDANFICWYCGVDTIELAQYGRGKSTVDHVIPRSRGGSDEPSNLVCACSICNQEKADMTLEEYRLFVWKQESAVARFITFLNDAVKEVEDERVVAILKEYRESEGVFRFHGERTGEAL